MRHARFRVAPLGVTIAVIAALFAAGELNAQTIGAGLAAKARSQGTVRVLVGFRTATPVSPEGFLTRRGVVRQRVDIAAARGRLMDRISLHNVSLEVRFRSIPYVAVEVDEDALEALLASADVELIVEDELTRPTLASSMPVIGAGAAWSLGYEGAGHAVAILDTGVEGTHSFFGGRVVWEGCFSTTSAGIGATTLCPNGQESMVGITGAASPAGCAGAGGCDHGTHVAGIAAGSGFSMHGVARGADIVALQVFSKFVNSSICGSTAPCLLSYTSDQMAALEQVLALKDTYNIAAANLSLGGGSYTSTCDGSNPGYKSIIDNLRSNGIATVIASGNNGFVNGTTSPGCISSAITVGATRDSDAVVSFSNSASWVDLLAPGVLIDSSVTGNSFGGKSGTSMATPHVTGAFAMLRSANPAASIDDILNALQDAGVPVTDSKSGITTSRIQVDDAVAALALVPPPVITTVSLPMAVAGAPYAVAIGADGGVAPLTFSLLLGSLPPGLSGPDPTTGVIDGTPTQAGAFPIRIGVTDSRSLSDERDFTLGVDLSTPTLVSPVDGSVTNDATPDFSWTPVVAANSYRLRVTNVTTGVNDVVDITTAGTTFTASGLIGGMLEWNVQAIAASVTGAASPNFRFELDIDPPSAVVLGAAIPDPTQPVSGVSLISSSGEQSPYVASLTTDGNPATFWSTPARLSPGIEALSVDLGAQLDVSGLSLYPRADFPALFPLDFDIQLSLDGSTYNTVMSASGVRPTTADPIAYSFAPTPARYLRLQVTRSAAYGPNYYTQLAELVVFREVPSFGAVQLDWLAPGDDGGAGRATLYEVRLAQGPTLDFDSGIEAQGEPLPKLAGSSESMIVDGLLPDTRYALALRSTDNAGNVSDVSNVVVVTTQGPPPEVTSDLTATPLSLDSVTLNWTAPYENAGAGGAVARYDVRYATSPITQESFDDALVAPNPPFPPAIPGNGESMVVGSLGANTLYYFALKSVDLQDNGSLVSNVAVTTTLDELRPGAVSDLGGGLSGNEALFTAATLVSATGEFPPYVKANSYDGDTATFWSSPARSSSQWERLTFDLGTTTTLSRVRARSRDTFSPFPSRLDLEVSSDGVNYQTVQSLSGLPETPATWYELAGGDVEARFVRVSALSVAWGASFYVQIAEVEIYESQSAPGAVTLQWTSPHEDEGNALSGAAASYDLRYSSLRILTDADFEDALPVPGTLPVPSAPGTLEIVTVNGFAPEEMNYFALKSRDSSGNVSALSNVVAVASPGIAPAPVADLVVVGASASSLDLEWTHAADDGTDLSSGPVSSYELRYSEAPISDLSDFAAATPLSPAPAPGPAGSTARVTVSGLSARETPYYFAVRSRDDADQLSPLSNVATGTTPDTEAPAVVSDLRASIVSGSVLLPVSGVSSSGEFAGLPATNVSDANPSTFWSTPARSVMQTEQITLDLGIVAEIGRVRMLSRSDNATLFPVDFNIGVSVDGSDFVTVEQRTSVVAAPGSWYEIDFAPTLGRFVRVEVTAANRWGLRYYVQIADIGVYQIPQQDRVLVSWTAPGNDGVDGIAASYDLRFSTSAIVVDQDFDNATPITGLAAPKPAGSSESFLIPGGVLPVETTVYFALEAADDASPPNVSSLPGALTSLNTPGVPPAAVNDLAATPETVSSIRLSWTAVGDDGNLPGTADSYDIRYRSVPIESVDDFLAATPITDGIPDPPAAQGVPESFVVAGLNPDTIYYFAMRVSDLIGNVSEVSNVSSATVLDVESPDPISDLRIEAGPGTIPVDAVPLSALVASFSGSLAGYPATNLVDGNEITFWSTPARFSPTLEHVSLDLGQTHTISRVKLLSRSDSGGFFPLSFRIQVSVDNTSFVDAHSEVNFAAAAGAWYTFDFSPVEAQYVRIHITSTNPYGNSYYAQLAEVAIYEDPGPSSRFVWTASGDDGANGTAFSYEIRTRDVFITEAGFGAAQPLSGVPSPTLAGTEESFTLPELSPGTHYFKIKVSDEAGNFAFSNTISTVVAP